MANQMAGQMVGLMEQDQMALRTADRMANQMVS